MDEKSTRMMFDIINIIKARGLKFDDEMYDGKMYTMYSVYFKEQDEKTYVFYDKVMQESISDAHKLPEFVTIGQEIIPVTDIELLYRNETEDEMPVVRFYSGSELACCAIYDYATETYNGVSDDKVEAIYNILFR